MTSHEGASSLFGDKHAEIAADDWEDQDLLTKDEARPRLQHKAELLEAELAALGPDAEPGVADEVRMQLAQVRRVLRSISGSQ